MGQLFEPELRQRLTELAPPEELPPGGEVSLA